MKWNGRLGFCSGQVCVTEDEGGKYWPVGKAGIPPTTTGPHIPWRPGRSDKDDKAVPLVWIACTHRARDCALLQPVLALWPER